MENETIEAARAVNPKPMNCPRCNAPQVFSGELTNWSCFSQEVKYPGKEAKFRQSWECTEGERDRLRAEVEALRCCNVSLSSQLAEKTAECERLKSEAKLAKARAALELAAKVFREYEQLHLAKGTPEGIDKAQVNANWAKAMETALEETK